MSVPIPTDDDGFLRRECPVCGQRFKWHHGPWNQEAAAAPDQSAFYCPLCGKSADTDSWWTTEQLEYARDSAMPDIMRQLENEISGLTVTETPAPPLAMVEPNDMQIVVPRCHPSEPVKVPDGHHGPFHCLLCGTPFAA